MIDQRRLDTILLTARAKADEILANYHLYMSGDRSAYNGEDTGRGIDAEPEGQPEDAGGEGEEPGAELAGEIYGQDGG